MREIWCHMFKAGFKSLRGIKIIKVFSLLLAVLWKNYKWLNHLCWSETTVGKWKESGFLSTKQGRKRLHYHSVSLRSRMRSLPQIPGPRPSEALWRGVCLMCKNQNWKRDSQIWLMIIIPWSAFWKEQISRLLRGSSDSAGADWNPGIWMLTHVPTWEPYDPPGLGARV